MNSVHTKFQVEPKEHTCKAQPQSTGETREPDSRFLSPLASLI